MASKQAEIRTEPEIVVEATPERFLAGKDEIILPLIQLLRELDDLEREVYSRSQVLEENKRKAGLPSSQLAPGSEELWEEYSERYGQIAQKKCTQSLLARGYARSYGSPGNYHYIHTGCRLVFTRKSPKRAVIVAYYQHGVESKQQFVLKNQGDGWKVDEVYYGFSNEKTWNIFHI